MRSNLPELTALLVAPDRELADGFISSLARSHAFQIVTDLRSYPSSQTLDIRLRQLRPDVLLIDLASSLETAAELIRFAAALPSPPQVVGLHNQNDSRAILLSLRMGASEFLYAPFDADARPKPSRASDVFVNLRPKPFPIPAPWWCFRAPNPAREPALSRSKRPLHYNVPAASACFWPTWT